MNDKYFVNDTEVDFIGEKDFATFMRFANRDLKPRSRYFVVELAIRLIKTN